MDKIVAKCSIETIVEGLAFISFVQTGREVILVILVFSHTKIEMVGALLSLLGQCQNPLQGCFQSVDQHNTMIEGYAKCLQLQCRTSSLFTVLLVELACL